PGSGPLSVNSVSMPSDQILDLLGDQLSRKIDSRLRGNCSFHIHFDSVGSSFFAVYANPCVDVEIRSLLDRIRLACIRPLRWVGLDGNFPKIDIAQLRAIGNRKCAADIHTAWIVTVVLWRASKGTAVDKSEPQFGCCGRNIENLLSARSSPREP